MGPSSSRRRARLPPPAGSRSRRHPCRRSRRRRRGLAGSFTDVQVLTDDAEPTFFYNTRTSLRDCEAQRMEMPLVWHEHVRGRLTDAGWTRVTLCPREASGMSVSFTFERRASGEWRADAPCLVTIAP